MSDIYSALNNRCDDSEQFLIRTQEIAASRVSSKLNCYCNIEEYANYTYSNIITIFYYMNLCHTNTILVNPGHSYMKQALMDAVEC